MVYSLQQLPADVLLDVFSYLSPADKLNVRACCKLFDRLVSHPSLWRRYTASFTFKNGRYNQQYWASVARRGIRSAAVRTDRGRAAAQENHWRALALALPSLSALQVENVDGQSCLAHLDKFPRLTRLALWGANCCKLPRPITRLPVADPRRVTHVSLCEVYFRSHDDFLGFLAEFSNLTSLAYHCVWGYRALDTFDCIVAGLPKLQHFSWIMYPPRSWLGVDMTGFVTTPSRTLSSLELVVYDDSSLPDDTMRSFSHLRSLTVFYVTPQQGCRLKTWLGHFQELDTLVVNGYCSEHYVGAIPATVSRLALCTQGRSTVDLAVVASRVPGLLHLQLDPWPPGCHAGGMAKLFPALQSVKMDGRQVEDFLDFGRFPCMRRIEVVDADSSPRVSELVRRLRTRMGDGVRVVTSTCRRDAGVCHHQL